MQAALGFSQLQRLNEFVECRRSLAKRYDESLHGSCFVTPGQNQNSFSSYHLYVIKLGNDCLYSRREVFNALRLADIGVNVHYIPIHLHPFYRKKGFKSGDFPFAEDYYEKAISLPLYPKLSETDQDYIISKLLEYSQ